MTSKKPWSKRKKIIVFSIIIGVIINIAIIIFGIISIFAAIRVSIAQKVYNDYIDENNISNVSMIINTDKTNYKVFIEGDLQKETYELEEAFALFKNTEDISYSYDEYIIRDRNVYVVSISNSELLYKLETLTPQHLSNFTIGYTTEIIINNQDLIKKFNNDYDLYKEDLIVLQLIVFEKDRFLLKKEDEYLYLLSSSVVSYTTDIEKAKVTGLWKFGKNENNTLFILPNSILISPNNPIVLSYNEDDNRCKLSYYESNKTTIYLCEFKKA